MKPSEGTWREEIEHVKHSEDTKREHVKHSEDTWREEIEHVKPSEGTWREEIEHVKHSEDTQRGDRARETFRRHTERRSSK